MATGDFNGDGFKDMAVGVPGESVGNKPSAGAVNVIYGNNTTGLNSSGNQVWYQNSTGSSEIAEAGDQFGWSLAAGDFIIKMS